MTSFNIEEWNVDDFALQMQLTESYLMQRANGRTEAENDLAILETTGGGAPNPKPNNTIPLHSRELMLEILPAYQCPLQLHNLYDSSSSCPFGHLHVQMTRQQQQPLLLQVPSFICSKSLLNKCHRTVQSISLLGDSSSSRENQTQESEITLHRCSSGRFHPSLEQLVNLDHYTALIAQAAADGKLENSPQTPPSPPAIVPPPPASEDCAICLSEMKTGDGSTPLALMVHCQHYFCAQCIQRLVERTKRATKCPICRAEHAYQYVVSPVPVTDQAARRALFELQRAVLKR